MRALSKEQQNKILSPPVLSIMRVLGGARAVGGAVRDVLLGRAAGDIDLATPLSPENVMAVLSQHRIKAVPTGLLHGTITAVVERVGYEITTLRRDVETFGRHARVEYTDDWQADAARRDFTMNALYVDAEGNLYDYFGGAEDARAGRVRFIGDARQRIQEDVLRVLRFFRFYASLGQGKADAEAVAACLEFAPLITTLSVERVAREFLKLLEAPDPLPALALMRECGMEQHFLPEMTDLTRLQTLLKNEKTYAVIADPLTRFAAILPQEAKVACAVARRLKLSNKDVEKLRVLAELPRQLSRDLGAKAVRAALYDYGETNTRAALLLVQGDIKEPQNIAEKWDNPIFPLSGKDLIPLGKTAGPEMGNILRKLEEIWREADFALDRNALFARAKSMGKNP